MRAQETPSFRHVGKAPSPVQLEDVPDPDGVNRWAGVLASLLAADPGLAAVIEVLVNPRPAEPDDTSSR